MGVKKDFKAMLRDVRAAGCEVKVTRGGHIKVTRPGYTTPVFMAATPSDHRAFQNVKATLRRILDLDV